MVAGGECNVVTSGMDSGWLQLWAPAVALMNRVDKIFYILCIVMLI